MTSTVQAQVVAAREAFLALCAAPHAARTAAIREFRLLVEAEREAILRANATDLAENPDLAPAIRDRLKLDDGKLDQVVAGLRDVEAAPNPVGEIIEETELDDGLILDRIRTPLGVVAVIFESRPDVAPQVFSLALKTGNALILKGGSEARHSNETFLGLARQALLRAGLPETAVCLLPDREAVAELLGMPEYVDLVIPRGSNALVRHIQGSTRIPVLGHADGICHLYVHRDADADMAERIAIDSKTQYPSACNSIETLLIDACFSSTSHLLAALHGAGVALRGCERALALNAAPMVAATEDDWSTEYGDLTLSVKIVESLDQAIEHVARYGSRHTEAIVTNDARVAEEFLNRVDAAGVYWNASTRFADGYRYGFGAEVGISTAKTHARGPVGIEGLTLYKYTLRGRGHVVSPYTGTNAKSFKHRKIESKGTQS